MITTDIKGEIDSLHDTFRDSWFLFSSHWTLSLEVEERNGWHEILQEQNAAVRHGLCTENLFEVCSQLSELKYL